MDRIKIKAKKEVKGKRRRSLTTELGAQTMLKEMYAEKVKSLRRCQVLTVVPQEFAGHRMEMGHILCAIILATTVTQKTQFTTSPYSLSI
jgi:hypothetical protein